MLQADADVSQLLQHMTRSWGAYYLALPFASVMMHGLDLPAHRQPSNTLVTESVCISDRLLERRLAQGLPVVLCLSVCVKGLAIRCLPCTYMSPHQTESPLSLPYPVCSYHAR